MAKDISRSVIGVKNDLTKSLRVEGSGSKLQKLPNPKTGPTCMCVRAPCNCGGGQSGPFNPQTPKSPKNQKNTPKNIPVITPSAPRQHKARRSSLKPYWEGIDPRKLSAGDIIRWKGVKTNMF